MDRATNRELVDPRDQESLDEAEDPARRDAILCALTAHRRSDRLEVGDAVPRLRLKVLSDANLPGTDTVDLADPGPRPVMLVFGSYT